MSDYTALNITTTEFGHGRYFLEVAGSKWIRTAFTATRFLAPTPPEARPCSDPVSLEVYMGEIDKGLEFEVASINTIRIK
jgi:hypothetical protein